ncbi:hypothetical protein SLS59_009827 [Nothophoma quercina]|uniref:N-acetyltransferase domain-containing protein n=1 Tax=Nothophoma quercina TaxID=749835 RepID=A0ABR3QJ64_9PLEO
MESYNSLRPAHFLQIRAGLIEQFPGFGSLIIEHIGSTAVLGLPAQPLIDVLVTATHEHIDEVATTLTTSGLYVHRDNPKHPDSSLFTASDAATPHTIYLCHEQSLTARAIIAIRDILRSDSELLEYYTDPKSQAAEGDTENRNDVFLEAYRDVQTPVLQHILVASQQFSNQELAILFHSNMSSRWSPVTTPRLLLREYEVGDVEGMYALESNPDNARYQSWHPWTHLEARQNVLRGILCSFDDARVTVELAVFEGEFVGRIGAGIRPLTGYDSVVAAEESEGVERKWPSKHADLWYSFLPSSQGKGFAKEAMRAFIDEVVKKEKEGEDYLELEIECDPRNTGSWRLAERLGFERTSFTERAWECKGEWVDSLVYRRLV